MSIIVGSVPGAGALDLTAEASARAAADIALATEIATNTAAIGSIDTMVLLTTTEVINDVPTATATYSNAAYAGKVVNVDYLVWFYSIGRPADTTEVVNIAGGGFVLQRLLGAGEKLIILGDINRQPTSQIALWTASIYASGSQVNYLGKDYVSNAITSAIEIPGTSAKWVSRLSYYDNLIDTNSVRPEVTENVGVENTGTNGLTSGTAACFSVGVVSLESGYIGIIKFSATAIGQLLLVQFRKITAGSWTEQSRNLLTTVAGKNTIDLTSLNITVLENDFFGLVPVAGNLPRWKSVVGKGHYEAPLTGGIYNFTNALFPAEAAVPTNVQVDLFYTIVKAENTAIELITAAETAIELLNDRIDVTQVPAEVIIKVAKGGTVGVDGIGFIGNRAIQDAIDSITDASYQKRYRIIVNTGVYEAVIAAEFNAGTAAAGADICFLRPKPYITVSGTDRDNCIIRGFLPNNLGTGYAYENYQTVKWGCDNFVFENVRIQGQNLRYAVHIDGGQLGNKDYVMKYRNCVIEHLGNSSNALTRWTSVFAQGLGTSDGLVINYEDCTFKCPIAPLQMHTNTSFNKPSIQKFKRCTFFNTSTNKQLAAMSNIASNQQDIIILENCNYINAYLFGNGYTDSLTTTLKQCMWNGYNTKFQGYGNDPCVFINGYGGMALRIKSKSTGLASTVTIDKNSTAFPLIIKDKDFLSGEYVSPIGETFKDGYAYRAGDVGLAGYAFGLLDIGVEIQTTKYLKSLGKRLGDCSTVNKTLTVIVDGLTYNIVFDKNYNGTADTVLATYTNDQIVAEITAVIGTWAVVEWGLPMNALSTYAEWTDVNKSAISSEVILKGMGVFLVNGLIRKALNTDLRIYGVALNDFTNGGHGRVMVRGFLSTLTYLQHFAKLDSGAAVVTGDLLGIGATPGLFNKTATIKLITCFANDYVSINT